MEAEASTRRRSLTNGVARALTASWFSVLGRAMGTSTAASVGRHDDPSVRRHAGKGSGDGRDANGAAGVAVGKPEVDSTVPGVAVRRLAQACGLLRSGGGGPTLAHVDMELRRNAVGKGRLGHREVFFTKSQTFLYFVFIVLPCLYLYGREERLKYFDAPNGGSK